MSTLKEGNSRVIDYLLVWRGLCLKRSAPPPTSIQSLTPSSRAWLLQYQWGGCAIPLDPTKAVTKKSNQKTRLLAGWKKACMIPNPQNCSQSWCDSLSPRHPVWAQRRGFVPGLGFWCCHQRGEMRLWWITCNSWSGSPRGYWKDNSVSLQPWHFNPPDLKGEVTWLLN